MRVGRLRLGGKPSVAIPDDDGHLAPDVVWQCSFFCLFFHRAWCPVCALFSLVVPGPWSGKGRKGPYPFVRPLSGAPLPQLKRLGVLALTNLSQPNLTALGSPPPYVELGGAGSVPCALVSRSRRRVGSYSCVIGQPTPLIFLGVPDTGTHVPPPPSAYRLAGPPLEHRV